MYFKSPVSVGCVAVALGHYLVVQDQALADPSAEAEIDYSNINTVVVVAEYPGQPVQTGSVFELDVNANRPVRPPTLEAALAKVPSVNVRTNSRGEVLAALRGAGERQLALYFDGAPVNVPWDNRFDLSQIPLSGIETLQVTRGPAAARFGANTAGGVIELSPRITEGATLSAHYGSGDEFGTDGFISGGDKGLNWLLSGSYSERDGLTLPDVNGNEALFSTDGDTITNTDKRLGSFAGRVSHAFSGGELFASVLYSDAAFGIAPEQGPLIEPGSERFWRSPTADHFLVTAGANKVTSPLGELGLTLWRQDYDQTIDAYFTNQFLEIEETQIDENLAYGGRLTSLVPLNDSQLFLSVSAARASHRQRNFDPATSSAAATEQELFSQNNYSFSADYQHSVGAWGVLAIGASYDVLAPDETGGRASSGDFSGLNATAELSATLSEDWYLRVGASRRVRLPTLRELFGEALGRFALNPDLQPETTWQFETEIGYNTPEFSFALIPFANLTSDTLDQRRFTEDGRQLRQRINLRGSRVYGFEALAQAQVTAQLTLSGALTWNRARRLRESVDNSVGPLYLSEVPKWLGRFDAQYFLGANTTFGLEVIFRGEARSLLSGNQFARLDAATKLGFSISHDIPIDQSDQKLRIRLAAENVTDAFVEPQLGLPEAGRRITLGLQYVF